LPRLHQVPQGSEAVPDVREIDLPIRSWPVGIVLREIAIAAAMALMMNSYP
jgi:hypothetical protein